MKPELNPKPYTLRSVPVYRRYFRYAITFIAVIFAGNIAVAQDFAKVDAKVASYPDTFSFPQELAEAVSRDFVREDEKARAIFYWIATHIRYDVKAFFSGKYNSDKSSRQFKSREEMEEFDREYHQKQIVKTMRSEKAVCQGYSELFKDVCLRCGLECELIRGASRSVPGDIGIKRPDYGAHVWNAVKIDGNWQLIDVTWGAGSVDPAKQEFTFDFNDVYFFTRPELFSLNHFPQDKNWLFTVKSEQEYLSQPFYYRQYIKGDYTILAPSQGILSTKDSVIKFRIEHFPPSGKVFYRFENGVSGYIKDIATTDAVSEFEIPLAPRTRGLLTLFMDNKSIVVYKIVP